MRKYIRIFGLFVAFSFLGMSLMAADYALQKDAYARNFGLTSFGLAATDDNDVAINIKFVGSSTTGQVTVSASTMTIIADGTAEDLVLNMGAASNDTMGELVDTLDGQTFLQSFLGASLRADASAGNLVAITTLDIINSNKGLGLEWDKSDVEHVSVVVQNSKFDSASKTAARFNDTDRRNAAGNIYAFIDFATKGALQIYDGSNKVFEVSLADTTRTAFTELEVQGKTDNPVVVRVIDTSTTAAIVGAYLNVVGESIKMR